MSLKFMGKKKGMTQIFDSEGNLIVCTVISAEPNAVVQIKNKDKDGYSAIQLGAEKLSPSRRKNLSKPLIGHFAKAKVEPCKHLCESRVSNDDQNLQLGQEVDLSIFEEGTFIDISSKSKGKGFQGVMKRHGFKGGPASHGSGFHRAAGSTGMRSTPGRNLPGGKKAGQMGNVKVTIQNLKIIKIDPDKQVILVKGAVPGANNAHLIIQKAKKKSTAGA